MLGRIGARGPGVEKTKPWITIRPVGPPPEPAGQLSSRPFGGLNRRGVSMHAPIVAEEPQ